MTDATIGNASTTDAGIRQIGTRRPRTKKPSILLLLFLISLAIPISFYIGPLRLSAYRLFLLAAVFPALFAWLSGSLGKYRLPDVLVLFFSIWIGISLVYNHGFGDSIESFGIMFLETAGAYFIARWTIRDADSFYYMVRCFFMVILFLIPFGVYELLTTRPIILDMLDKVFNVFPNVPKVPRWGLDRVQGPFEHPILFGVFCSGAFSLSIYVLGYGKGIFGKITRGFTTAFAVFLSLSSGPLSALLAQIVFIAWDNGLKRFQGRWSLFFSLTAIAYVVVDMISNRTPLKVFISYTAFNLETAYGRIMIWDVGSAEVARHPIFGIGDNLWEHGPDLTASLDMFWLLNAVSYGLPGGISIFLAMAFMLIGLSRKKLSDPKLSSYRLGIVFAIAGLSLAGWGVHFWNATYCLFMFLLGSGAWLLNERDVDGTSHPARSSSFQRRHASHDIGANSESRRDLRSRTVRSRR